MVIKKNGLNLWLAAYFSAVICLFVSLMVMIYIADGWLDVVCVFSVMLSVAGLLYSVKQMLEEKE